MNRTFIEVPMFTKKWHELGLTDEELRNLENVLLENPKAGDAILVVPIFIVILFLIYFFHGLTKFSLLSHFPTKKSLTY